MRLPGLLEYAMRISLDQAIACLLRLPQSRSPAKNRDPKGRPENCHEK